MEQKKKCNITVRGWVEAGVSLAIFVALALVAAFCDLAINKALYNPDSLYGQFFQRLGEWPSYLTPAVAGCILFYQPWGRKKWEKVAWKVLMAAVIFAGFYFTIGKWFWKNFVQRDLGYAVVYKLLFTCIATGVTLLIGLFVPKKAMKKLVWFAVFLVVVVALSNVICQIMKMIWARQRFRVMVYDNQNFSGFTPWYLPQGFTKRDPALVAFYEGLDKAHGAGGSDAFKSFPSGHTCAAAASFGLIILPEMYPELNAPKKKVWFWVAPIAYTCLVALSRIVMGAHYLSDVLFGGFVGYTVACMTRWLFMAKNWLNKPFILEKVFVTPAAPSPAEANAETDKAE